MTEYKIHEVCGDWALDIITGNDIAVLFFNSRANAELVKNVLEWESSHPNEAIPFMKPIIDRIGLPALLEQTAEECAELVHACLKEARRLRGENPTPCTAEECYSKIADEEADVYNCMMRLLEAGYMWTREDMEGKLDRWHQRLDEAGK